MPRRDAAEIDRIVAAQRGEAQPIRRRGRPRGYHKSGFYALKATLRDIGPRVIDKRTTMGRMMAALKADIIRDLGGDVSTQQVTIIDLAVKQKLLLDSIDAWLLTQASLIDVDKRALIPVVRERQYVADGLARYLVALGLDRTAAPVEDLDAFLARREREQAEQAESPVEP